MSQRTQPTDVNQLGKFVVDGLTGARKAPEPAPEPTGRARGGQARAEALTPQRRSEIARKAARARWGKSTLNAG